MNRFSILVLGALAIGALACSSPPGRAADGQGASVVQVVALGYLEDRQTAAFRTTVTADTLTTAAILATPALTLDGRKSISVTPCLSNSGATITFVVAYVNRAGTDVLAVTDPVTLTSGSVRNLAGEYLCPAFDFTARGFYHARIVCVTGASAGTCPHLNIGSY